MLYSRVMLARTALALAVLLPSCGGRLASGPADDAAAGSAGVSVEAGAGGASGSEGGTVHTGGSRPAPTGGRTGVSSGGSGGGVTTGGNGAGGADAGLCGNGRVDPDETCDDGNVLPGDGCSQGCQLEDWDPCPDGQCILMVVCGDAVLAGDEVCDDGNVTSGDGCRDDCAAVEPGYYCPRPGAPCVPDSVPGCGDATVQPELGEECDNGFNRGGYGTCAPGCVFGPYCGDGIVDSEFGEECDLGSKERVGACMPSCRLLVD
jgi:cysteine-rich repeat protein